MREARAEREAAQRAKRAREVTRIVRRLGEQVTALAPPGTGKRDDVWEAVAPADRALHLALTRWADTGGDANKQAAREAYRTLLEAWKGAVSLPERRSA